MEYRRLSDFFSEMLNRGPLPLLERTVSFTSARHRVIAENIANVDTPGYRTKQLDARAFQRSLREAAKRRATSPDSPFKLRATRELREDSAGRLKVRPSEVPPENLLFHDGTNARVEQQMSNLAENAVAHQTAVELLKGSLDGLMKAIRGRVS